MSIIYKKPYYFRKTNIIITIVFLTVVIIMLSACQNQEETDYEVALNITDSPESSITVTWYSQTDKPSFVYFAEESNFDKDNITKNQKQNSKSIIVREDEYYRHSATLTGLKENTTYNYTVGNKKNNSTIEHFTTASNKQKTKFMFLGDIQYQIRDRDYQTWGEYIKTAYKKNNHTDLVLLGGDMVDKSGDTADWSSLFNNGEYIFNKIPIATTVGNHETSVIPFTYKQMLSMPENGPSEYEEEFYSFDYGSCHFISLNSCFFMDERKNDFNNIEEWEQALTSINKWINDDIKNTDKEWIIVYMHHPPYPISEDDKIYKELRNAWVPIFEEGGVSAVFCGHQHVYMKTKELNGITYFMSSSGEKPSYYYDEKDEIPEYVDKLYQNKSYITVESDSNSLNINIYDENHEALDSKEIKNATSPLH